MCARDVRFVAVDQEHGLEVGKRVAHRRDLAPVERTREVTSTRPASELHALADRLRPERREERRHDRPQLQRAEHRDVQLGDAAEQREHGVARAHAERRERVGHAVRLLVELAVRQLASRVVLAEPDQGGMITAARRSRAG